MDLYNNSFVIAVLSLYPDIGLDQSQFYSLRMKRTLFHLFIFFIIIITYLFINTDCFVINNIIEANFWIEEGNMKVFFERLAAKLGFDPLSDSERWYNIKRKDIGNQKV